MDHLAAFGRTAADLANSAFDRPAQDDAKDNRRSWLGPAICLLLAVASFYWTLDWLQSEVQLASSIGF
jgi:ferric-dicitrate binding protein FerR (iron transport regulator)